jgi:hypothetical protein
LGEVGSGSTLSLTKVEGPARQKRKARGLQKASIDLHRGTL